MSEGSETFITCRSGTQQQEKLLGLLVHGYIRNVEKNEMKKGQIPKVIGRICFKFYHQRVSWYFQCNASTRVLREYNDWKRKEHLDFDGSRVIKIYKEHGNQMIDWTGRYIPWTASIDGPINSPYEGGTFWFEVQIPNNYPRESPSFKCLTTIYHPNITTKRFSLKRPQVRLTILMHLCFIIRILKEPHNQNLYSQFFSDPPNAEIAALYETDREKYNKNCREWTKRYAT